MKNQSIETILSNVIVGATLDVESKYSEVALLGDAVAALESHQLALLVEYLEKRKHMLDRLLGCVTEIE